jgi:polysaccharide biosynthesis transport protein
VELRTYLAVLRIRWIIIVACLGIALVAVGVLVLRAPRIYSAKSTVFLSVSVGQSTADLSRGFAYAQGLVNSYAQVVTQPTTLLPVITSLGLDLSPDKLARLVTVDTPLETLLINITVATTSPDLAANISNGIAQQLSSTAGALVPGADHNASPVSVTIVSPASVPSAPSSPRVALNFTVGALGGGFIGIVLAFARDILDVRISGPRDVERVTDVPVIGTITLSRETPRWFRGGKGQAENLAKELRTNFQHACMMRRLRSVVFTSAQDDRATGITVTILGVELAHAGLRTVLVDGDIRKPSLGPWSGAEHPYGLSSVLVEQVGWRDALHNRGRTLLSVLPAGPPLSDPSAVLNPAAMSALIGELADNFDVVLIKSPPVLRVADGLLFARIVDGTVVVADGPMMNRTDLAEELHALGVADALLIGIVLTT